MHFASDHPRTWAEIVGLLNAAEAAAFTTYVQQQGISPDQASAATMEGLYTAWRLLAVPLPTPAIH